MSDTTYTLEPGTPSARLSMILHELAVLFPAAYHPGAAKPTELPLLEAVKSQAAKLARVKQELSDTLVWLDKNPRAARERAERIEELEQQVAQQAAELVRVKEENRELNMTISRLELIFNRTKVEYQGDSELSLRQFFVQHQRLEAEHAALLAKMADQQVAKKEIAS